MSAVQKKPLSSCLQVFHIILRRGIDIFNMVKALWLWYSIIRQNSWERIEIQISRFR